MSKGEPIKVPLSATDEMLSVNGTCPDHLYSTIFSLSDSPGILLQALKPFASLDVSMSHIESRAGRSGDSYDFYVEFICEKEEVLDQLTAKLEEIATSISLMTEGGRGNKVPWFPRYMKDLDKFSNRVLSMGAELSSDHPGFTDPIYRARRAEFADIAIKHKHGESIPRVEYTEKEINTWNEILTQLSDLFPTHACKEFNRNFPLLRENCGYKIGNIPQLEDVSNYLKQCSGFTLRPVAGLLSSRDFLAGLAFRVFHSTQYIRHHSNPTYTPEPDVCHELIGHVPLFADPKFAEFSQEIGLASLGISDEYIKKLATLYWFTIEFGVCRQDGELRAYGAGLLSSFGELQYCLSDKPEREPLEPEVTADTSYPITEFQPKYFVAEGFENAKRKLRKYAESIPRPFTARYNPYTQCVEILSRKEQIVDLSCAIQGDISILQEALTKLT